MSKVVTIDKKIATTSTFRNRATIERSKLCECYYCLKTFPSDKIVKWADQNQTALCPYCGIDSVIGDASGVALTRRFLENLNVQQFGSSRPSSS